jgi:hypothetical protein
MTVKLLSGLCRFSVYSGVFSMHSGVSLTGSVHAGISKGLCMEMVVY